MALYKRIEEAPNVLVCSDGYVINIDNGFIYKNIKKSTGYYEVSINGKGRSLHRLVAKAFCDGYEDGKEVNHIDGDKSNNKASNLEWVDHNTNLRHAFLNGLRSQDVSNRRVVATDMVTGQKLRFSSIYKAARHFGISQGNICLCCQGKRPYANGYYWEYERSFNNE